MQLPNYSAMHYEFWPNTFRFQILSSLEFTDKAECIRFKCGKKLFIWQKVSASQLHQNFDTYIHSAQWYLNIQLIIKNRRRRRFLSHVYFSSFTSKSDFFPLKTTRHSPKIQVKGAFLLFKVNQCMPRRIFPFLALSVNHNVQTWPKLLPLKEKEKIQ